MKQLMTYISPDHDFNSSHKIMVEIQIDNSLSLGWKIEDILLLTNFNYEYNGVKSIVIPDDNYCKSPWTSTKIFVIHYALHHSLIKELTWYHDFDCFQINPFIYIEEDMKDADFGLAQYGRMPRLASSSMFFRPEAVGFIDAVKQVIIDRKYNEEFAIMKVCKYHELPNATPQTYNVRKIDITYALHRHNFNHVWARAKKPIQAAHFHLTPDKYDIFVRGINKANQVVIPQRLINIFHKHGFTGQDNNLLQ